MIKRLAILLVSALLLVVALRAFRHLRATPASTATEPETGQIASTSYPSLRSQQQKTVSTLKHRDAQEADIASEIAHYVERNRADPTYDWKQPISFYGLVVNESNEPIADVNIHFAWNDLSQKGTSEADVQSDVSGRFSLEGKMGKRLCVSATKNGYYTASDASARCYEFANPADGLFAPDPSNPVVLHLRRKGVGADLITSQYGIKDYFGVLVPLNGTPVRVDLLQRKSGGQEGQLILSQLKPTYAAWKDATQWAFRMEIPNGGFLENTDEFPFEAPETGYQPIVEFEFQQGQTNWATMLKRDFYIEFGNPSIYGRLHVDTRIEMDGARLTYAINPEGSRNLEPK